MMKGKLRIAGSMLLTGLLCACADTARIERDLKRVERNLGDLRNFQAEQTTQLASLQSEVRSLSGKLEEVEHSQKHRGMGDPSGLGSYGSTGPRRVPPPPIVPVTELERDESLAATLPGELSSSFLGSLQKIREGSFQSALPLLQNALELSGGKELSANILFWMGVAYDGLGENKNALSAYNDVVTSYPRHSRAPAALYREGSVFIRLGDMKAAKLAFKKLAVDYPKSPEADLARGRLRDL